MGESTPIVYSEAIDPSLMPTFIAQAKEAIALLAELEAGFRSTLKASTLKGSPTTLSDYTIQADGIHKADLAFKGLIETEKKKNKVSIEALQLEQRLNQIEKDKIKSAKESAAVFIKAEKDKQAQMKVSSSLYKQASKELNDLRNAYKELSLAGRENGIVAKGLLLTITEQDQKLKKLDATVGQHQRHVGSYSEALKTLGKGAGGLVGIFATLGRALGFNTEAIEQLHTASTTLIKVTREYNHALHLQHLAHKENEAAIVEETIVTEESIAVEKESTAVKTAMIGPIGWIGIALAATAAVVYYFRDAIFGLTDAEKEKMKADDGVIISDEKVRAEYNKTIREIRDLTLEYKHLTGAIDDYHFSLSKISNKTSDVITDLRKEKEAKLEEHDSYWNMIFQSDETYENERMKIEHDYNALRDQQYKIDADEKLNIKAEFNKKQNEADEEWLDDFIKEFKKKTDEEKEAYKKYLADRLKMLNDIVDAQRLVAKGEQDRIDKENEERLKKEKEHNENMREEFLKEQKAQYERDRPREAKEDASFKKHKELVDKRTQDELESIDKVNSAIGEGLDRRNDAQMNALKIQGDQIQSEMMVQEKLFADGLDNTLAYDEKAKAENTEKELALARKAAKEKKAIELAHTYISFLQSFLKDGSNPESAAVKALASTLVSQGIADAIAGSAFDGVEDTGNGNMNLDGKGGMLYMVHPNERIVPKSINEKLGDISNDELGNIFDNDFNALYRPNFLANIPSDSIGGKGNVDMGTLMELNGKMIRDGIEKGFSKIQITNYDLNVYGKIVENHTSNGISKTYIHQSDVFK